MDSNNVNDFKFIFKGRLDFGNKRSYDNVLNMYEWKMINHYKKDVHLDPEELFDENKFSLTFPRSHVSRGLSKNFKATYGLLKYLSDYALAGQVEMWKIKDREVVEYHLIEPKSDRATVIQFSKGKRLADSEETHEEAMVALDAAIAKYEKHAQAYERRAFINTVLQKYHDAIRDYTKSINIYAGAPDPYYGRGMVQFKQDNFDAAVEDFDTAIKRSIPLQPVHWKARRRKAECLIELGILEEAGKELRFFTMRQFKPENPNFKYRKKAFYDYGRCLYAAENYNEATKVFDSAYNIESGKNAPSQEEILYYRGMSKHKAGKRDFKSDLKLAAKGGHKNAAEMLAEV